MCELEAPISTVPEEFILGLELIDLSVCIKYFQKDILWDINVSDYRRDHLRQPLKIKAEYTRSAY